MNRSITRWLPRGCGESRILLCNYIPTTGAHTPDELRFNSPQAYHSSVLITNTFYYCSYDHSDNARRSISQPRGRCGSAVGCGGAAAAHLQGEEERGTGRRVRKPGWAVGSTRLEAWHELIRQNFCTPSTKWREKMSMFSSQGPSGAHKKSWPRSGLIVRLSLVTC